MFRYYSCYLSFLLLCQTLQVWAVDFDECEGVADGSLVSSLESCQGWVYCDSSGQSERGDCAEGLYFNPLTDECDLEENVECFLDVEEPAEPLPDEDENEEAEEPEDTEEEPNEEDSTEAPPEDIEIINTAPVVKPNCPLSDDPSQVILMANNNSCTGYFLCYHGQAMQMECTNELHFNPRTAQCDYPENVQCALESNAHRCLPHMTGFFPHADKCNYFYYCIKGFLTLQQCPFYYGWDVERRSCVQMSVAKCFGNAKRS